MMHLLISDEKNKSKSQKLSKASQSAPAMPASKQSAPQSAKQQNFIFITGGVISSVGKGILTSSLGALLEAQGYSITAMKIDPYINIDAGTMRPTEHGEVFVTDDGFETDQDLGNYERFTHCLLSKDHSITTGQVYLQVIKDEREGKYHGKCVEVIPHIPLEVIRRIKKVADASKTDFVLVEIGATAGEYQIFPFLDAARRMKFQGDNVVFVHIGYLPIPKKVGEQKTKPLQRSIFDLLNVGIKPDFVVGRSELPMDDERKEKLALNCSIKKENVISAQDLDFVYDVPVNFHEQGFDKRILEEFGLPYSEKNGFTKWTEKASKIKNLKKEIKIGIVGKYFDIGDFCLEDSYISVIESVKHAAWSFDMKPKIVWIDSKSFEKDAKKINELANVDALIVPGGFGESGVEGKIMAIKYAREKKIPYLGLCYGMQLAVVEFARNVCGMKGAHTTEIDRSTKYPIIDILPEQRKKLEEKNFGASMRLGAYAAKLKKGTQVYDLYGMENISERHRHRWEVNRNFVSELEKNGLIIAGRNDERDLVEFIELPKKIHPYFVATQAHPEFKSKFMQPAPLFVGLLKAAISRK